MDRVKNDIYERTQILNQPVTHPNCRQEMEGLVEDMRAWIRGELQRNQNQDEERIGEVQGALGWLHEKVESMEQMWWSNNQGSQDNNQDNCEEGPWREMGEDETEVDPSMPSAEGGMASVLAPVDIISPTTPLPPTPQMPIIPPLTAPAKTALANKLAQYMTRYDTESTPSPVDKNTISSPINPPRRVLFEGEEVESTQKQKERVTRVRREDVATSSTASTSYWPPQPGPRTEPPPPTPTTTQNNRWAEYYKMPEAQKYNLLLGRDGKPVNVLNSDLPPQIISSEALKRVKLLRELGITMKDVRESTAQSGPVEPPTLRGTPEMTKERNQRLLDEAMNRKKEREGVKMVRMIRSQVPGG